MRAAVVTAVLTLTTVLVSPLPLAAQQRFTMRFFLGQQNELEVEAQYLDPADIDEQLKGTRVIPFWLRVRNVSAANVTLRYDDLTLDLGGTGSPLTPVPGDVARSILERDGKYVALVRFLTSQGNDYENRPLSRILASGVVGRGQRREGHVLFVRPDNVPLTGFMALGLRASPSALPPGPAPLPTGRGPLIADPRIVIPRPQMLSTRVFDVLPAARESSTLWTVAMGDWSKRIEGAKKAIGDTWEDLKRAVDEIRKGPPPFRRSYALLIGVSEYTKLRSLPMVRNDLAKLKEFLQSQQFTVITKQDQAVLTLSNIRSPQQFFLDGNNNNVIGPQDRLVVFFAGHGFQRVENGQTRGYLALRDADPNNFNPQHAIAMDEFVAWAQRVPANHLLILLESCFSGLAVRGAPRVPSVQTMGDPPALPQVRFDPARLYRLATGAGRFVMMAGEANQLVPMSSEWGGGLFADAVVQGLKGRADVERDGFVTVRELFQWLKIHVEDEALRVFKSPVTPLITDLGPDRTSPGDFVFIPGL